MNKACLKCGHIMLVPDIPLPKSYRQKCTACGFENPVGDDLYYEETDDLGHSSQGPMAVGSETDALDFGMAVEDPIDMSRDRTGGTGSHDSWSDNSSRGMSQPLPQNGLDNSAELHLEPHETITDGDLIALRQEITSDMEVMSEKLEERIARLETRLETLAAQADLARVKEAAPSARQTTSPDDKARPLVARSEALLCTKQGGLIKGMEAVLARASIALHCATSHALALKKMQEYAFETIILDQAFVQNGPDGQAILAGIKKIALPIRRQQAVLLITSGLATCESQVFYQWAIDMNVHYEDLGQFPEFLQNLLDLKQEMLYPYLHSEMDTDRIML